MEMFPETSGTAGAVRPGPAPRRRAGRRQAPHRPGPGPQSRRDPGTLDTLRARAYLHLLSGQPAATLILQTASPGRTATPATAPRPPGRAATRPPGTRQPAPAPRDPAPAPELPAGCPAACPGLRGTVNLTMPLSAWLGWTQSPGDVPGYGPIDADDSRALAGLLAQTPPTSGASPSPTPPGTPSPTPAPATAPTPRRHHHATADPAARLRQPGRPGRPRASTQPRPRPPPGPGLAARTDLHHPGKPRDCTHPRQSHGYQPSRVPAPPHPHPQPHLHRPRMPTRRHPLRPRPRDPLRPRRPDLRMQPSPRLPPRPPHQASPRLDRHLPCPGTLTWTTPGHRSHTTTPAQLPGINAVSVGTASFGETPGSSRLSSCGRSGPRSRPRRSSPARRPRRPARTGAGSGRTRTAAGWPPPPRCCRRPAR